MNPIVPARLEAERTPVRTWIIPVLTVLAGSLVTIVPVVTTMPILPPFGLLMLLGWRLLKPDALTVWSPVLLGLADDLLSGQPAGSAVLLWTTCFFVIELIEIRLVWRDFWQDWLIATGAIAFCLIVGRFLASPIGAHVDTMLLLQTLVSILLYPVIARLCARLDRARNPA